MKFILNFFNNPNPLLRKKVLQYFQEIFLNAFCTKLNNIYQLYTTTYIYHIKMSAKFLKLVSIYYWIKMQCLPQVGVMDIKLLKQCLPIRYFSDSKLYNTLHLDSVDN